MKYQCDICQWIYDEEKEGKKFEDLPACLKVKSDLSFRRALKLIDDVMAAKQITKPENQ